MMNALALGLVLTSLVTAGFFTPTPEKQIKQKDDVIVKEGRRVVVVEYEKDEGNTKVSISPQDNSESFHKNEGVAAKWKEKLSEKIEDMKEGTKEWKEKLSDVKEGTKEEIHTRFRPRELVCDAYGKCKHKIASVIGKTKEEGVSDSAHKAFDEAKDSFDDSAKKAKEKVAEKAGGTIEEASRRMEWAKEKASGIKEEASRRMEGAKEKASGIKEEASRRMEGAREAKKEGEKELSEIMHHARDVVVEVFNYVFFSSVAPVTGVLHLMGFAAAYGMCVWVTFASSHVLAGALPRQQFAMVQSRIYPLYFKAMGYSVGMALLGNLMSPGKILGGMLRGFDLVAALALILVNLFYLEPRATKVMHERMKMEKEERQATEASSRGKRDETKSEMTQTLQTLNSYSSFLNVMTLVSLTWHLLRLAPPLHTVC